MDSQDQFRNVQPRSREERKEGHDKASLEKRRLKERHKHYHRAPGQEFDMSLTCEGSQGYISEAQRFSADAVGLEKSLREEAIQKRQSLFAQKRSVNAEMEANRWQKQDDEYYSEQQKQQSWRENSDKAKRNQSSVPYDPITLKYHATDEGLYLKYSDDLVKWRQHHRSINIENAGNNKQNIHPITGANKDTIDGMEKPSIPSNVKAFFEQPT